MRNDTLPRGAEDRRPRRHVVAIGGGHGLSRTLLALRRLDVEITAIVSVADDGGSSGRLREQYGVVPPGDLRVALASLVPDADVAAALQHRWQGGDLDGHAMGNLLIMALAAVRGGNFTDAFERLGELLGAEGRVIPCTAAEVHLVADGEDGLVHGQVAIATSSGHRRVWLDPPDPVATPEAVAAIEAADMVVLGPGSLFTSVLPNLAVDGICDALKRVSVPIIHVANLRQQPAETLGMDLASHLDVLTSAMAGRHIDVVVQHEGPAPAPHGSALSPLTTHPHVGRFVATNLLDGTDGHDPAALARVLSPLLDT